MLSFKINLLVLTIVICGAYSDIINDKISDDVSFKERLRSYWKNKFLKSYRHKRSVLNKSFNENSIKENGNTLVIITNNEFVKIKKNEGTNSVEQLIDSIIDSEELLLLDNLSIEREIFDNNIEEITEKVKRSYPSKFLDPVHAKDRKELEAFIEEYNKDNSSNYRLKDIISLKGSNSILLIDEKKARNLPIISIEHSVVEPVEGTDFHLDCKMASIPAANFTLFGINGEVLKHVNNIHFGTINYTLDGIQEDQTGIYKCISHNRVGSTEESILIKVKPSGLSANIVSLIQPLSENNSSLKIICQVPETFQNKTKIIWYRDEEEINFEENNEFKLFRNNLEILHLHRQYDENNFTCVVQMRKIKKTSSIILDVNYSPSFPPATSLNETIRVPYGEEVTLDCDVKGKPSPSINWLVVRDHLIKTSIESLVPIQSNVYVIDRMSPSDEGMYMCSGFNIIGTSQIKQFHLIGQPNDVPSLREIVYDKIVLHENDDLELNYCECINCKPLKLQWTLNDEPCENDENDNFKIDSNDSFVYNNDINQMNRVTKITLNIEKIRKSQEGTYKCIIENEEGSSEISVKVVILDDPDITPLDLVTVKPTAGDIAFTTCESITKVTYFNYYVEDEKQLFKSSVRIDTEVKMKFYGKLYSCKEYQITETGNTINNFTLISVIETNDWNDTLVEEFDNVCEFESEPHFNGNNSINVCNSIGDKKSDTKKFVIIESQEVKYPLIDKTAGIMVNAKENLKLACDFLPYGPDLFSKTSYSCDKIDWIGIDLDNFDFVRKEPPTIMSKLDERVTILPGDRKHFDCIAYGNPYPKYYWTKGDNEDQYVQIEDKPNILEFTITDAGLNETLSCNAVNNYGHSKQSIEVQFKNAPKLSTNVSYSEYVVSLDQIPVLLECPIEGVDSYTWIKTSDESNKKMFLLDLVGNFTCFGKNEAGEANYTYSIVLETPPSAMFIDVLDPVTTNDKKNIEMSVNQNFAAKCWVQFGKPNPNIVWLKDNDHYSNNDLLEISSVTLDSSGTYTCRASNNKGQVQQSIELEVLAPPLFINNIEIEETVNYIAGEKAYFNCSADAYPQPITLWYHNDELIENETNDVLVIENLAFKDSGNYGCNVTNFHGSIQRKFNILVTVPLHITYISPQQEVMEGDELRLTCNTIENPLAKNFSWIYNEKTLMTLTNSTQLKLNDDLDMPIYIDKDQNEIFSEDLYNQDMYGVFIKSSINDEITFELVIVKSEFKAHSGFYTCLLANDQEQPFRMVSVNILSAPHIDGDHDIKASKNQNILIYENLQQRFECPIIGNPSCEYIWKLNNKIIESTRKSPIEFEEYGKIIKFLKITLGDAGQLECVGKNSLGKERFVFEITVDGTPKIIFENGTIDSRASEEIEVKRGETIELSCPSLGKPKTKWFGYNQRSYYELNRGTILRARISSSTKYICVLENRYGTVKKRFDILVATPLEIVGNKQEKLKIKQGTYLYLTCKIKGEPKPELLWYKENETITEQTNETAFYISKTEATDAGNYRCEGVNRFNKISKEFMVEIYHPEWSEWSEWSECLEPCGVSHQHRLRTCMMNGYEAKGQCDGDYYEITECIKPPCKETHGNWSKWSDWSPCSLECHDTRKRIIATKTRYRQCDNPEPQQGGKYCEGSSEEHKNCSELPNCPIDGGWGKWRTLPCSVKCGEGIQVKHRICNNPIPKYNGKKCTGNKTETTPCTVACDAKCGKNMVFNDKLKRCEDLDECTTGTHSCEQLCHNKLGGYTCECFDGYILNNDGVTCSEKYQMMNLMKKKRRY